LGGIQPSLKVAITAKMLADPVCRFCYSGILKAKLFGAKLSNTKESSNGFALNRFAIEENA
jgi:hypothetical protein